MSETREADPFELPDGLYDELRAIARRLMRSERSHHTLQPTAIVHEAWTRLARTGERPALDRAQFLHYVTRVMRNLLVDHARGLAAAKRDGGDVVPIDAVLHVVLSDERPDPIPFLDLDAALSRLAARDAELARIVELRFLSGLTLEETADLLGKTVKQIRRAWELARAWLLRDLRRGDS